MEVWQTGMLRALKRLESRKSILGSEGIQEAEDTAEKQEWCKKSRGGWPVDRRWAGSLIDAVGIEAKSGSFGESYAALTWVTAFFMNPHRTKRMQDNNPPS